MLSGKVLGHGYVEAGGFGVVGSTAVAVPGFCPWLLPQQLKMGYWVFSQCYSLPHSQILPPLSGCYSRSKVQGSCPAWVGRGWTKPGSGAWRVVLSTVLVAPGAAFLR